jgi:hypothetical protein
MSRTPRDDRALRREALATRASLQRLQLVATVERARSRAGGARGVGALALRAAVRAFGGRRAVDAPAPPMRPWMVSGGVMAWRLLRRSPTARWVLAAAAVGAAVWWVARTLRTSEPPDDSG